MADIETLTSAFMKADAAGDTANAKILADAIRAARSAAPSSTPQVKLDPATLSPQEGMLDKAGRYAKELAGGAVAGLKSQSAGLMGAAEWLGGRPVQMLGETMRKHGLAPTPEELAANRAWVKKSGPMADVGEITSSVATSLLPLSAATQAMKVGGAVPVLGDMAANAAWNAATTPGGAKERGIAAATAVPAVAGGRMLTRAMQGPLKNMTTQEAQILMDEGIQPTAGQMVSGEGMGTGAKIIAGLENKARMLPGIGNVIEHAQDRSLKEYNKAEINSVLQPLGSKVAEAGKRGVDQASDIIDRTIASSRGNRLALGEAADQMDILKRALTKSKHGVFKPEDVIRAGERVGEETPLATVAKEALSTTTSPSSARILRGLIGTAMAGGSAVTGGAGLVPLAGATGLTAGLYSKRGLKYLAEGIPGLSRVDEDLMRELLTQTARASAQPRK